MSPLWPLCHQLSRVPCYRLSNNYCTSARTTRNYVFQSAVSSRCLENVPICSKTRIKQTTTCTVWARRRVLNFNVGGTNTYHRGLRVRYTKWRRLEKCFTSYKLNQWIHFVCRNPYIILELRRVSALKKPLSRSHNICIYNAKLYMII